MDVICPWLETHVENSSNREAVRGAPRAFLLLPQEVYLSLVMCIL